MNLIKIFARMYDLNFARIINSQKLFLLNQQIMITKKVVCKILHK